MKNVYQPKLEIEKKLTEEGLERICGVDEAGRGPLAGPIVVAAVRMPWKNPSKIVEWIDDSKTLSEKKREQLYLKIINIAQEYKIAVIDNFLIDEINILEATKVGMKEVAAGMKESDAIISDAVKFEADIPVFPVIKGDFLSYNVAAASIVAKVTRDRMMRIFAEMYPEYGFERHKGYGTKAHIEAIGKFGLCPIHRITFCGKFVANNDKNDDPEKRF